MSDWRMIEEETSLVEHCPGQVRGWKRISNVLCLNFVSSLKVKRRSHSNLQYREVVVLCYSSLVVPCDADLSAEISPYAMMVECN